MFIFVHTRPPASPGDHEAEFAGLAGHALIQSHVVVQVEELVFLFSQVPVRAEGAQAPRPKDICALYKAGASRLSAAYEHDDGKTMVSTYGYNIDAPKLTGGTGIGEIELTLKSSARIPVKFQERK